MMSAQMLQSASASKTVSDLTSGIQDGMQLLEAKAAALEANASSQQGNFFQPCPTICY